MPKHKMPLNRGFNRPKRGPKNPRRKPKPLGDRCWEDVRNMANQFRKQDSRIKWVP